MKYDFNTIEAKWQKYWADNKTFKAQNPSSTPSEGLGEAYYVLDMFPYPSGAGLHVGHPLGYIASDIVARYKRHQGFNVLHPQGYDSFGLPAEQYAIQTGQHPAITTETNIKRYREQLDKIGFSFDWSREVRTSDPEYYKWTQWIFIQLFNSWYNKTSDKAEEIETLISIFEKEGNTTVNAVSDEHIEAFSADDWNAFSSEKQQQILLQYRLTYLAETEVNWCPALGTVLANDEIVNGVSERGGHPVIRKKMTQWSMRISAYAERLLQGLETIDWSESIKESQRNWIGKSVGASVEFPILTFPKGEGTKPGYMTGGNNSHLLLDNAKHMRNNPTEAESIVWEYLKSKNLEDKFRRQHLIDDFIVDFVCLSKKLVIEIDGGIHEQQKEYDEARTKVLNEKGFKVIRFKNEEVIGAIENVLSKIKNELDKALVPPLGVRGIEVFTTRPDTIFGVSFMTLAPEHELVAQITTPEQKSQVDAYIEATAKRSERERMADVKTISGVFTGAYAEHPFTQEPIPIWIGDYVLAGYGTGAVMAVPSGDERDYAFAKHFNLPIKNIFSPLTPEGGIDESDDIIKDEAFVNKSGFVYKNSDFLNGLDYKAGTKKIIEELEKINAGKAKVNYRLRDAVFSRQRYWGEPFPVYYVNGLPQMIDAKHLPIRLPEVEKYLPTETGEPPLGNATVWAWDSVNNKVVSSSAVENKTIFPLELNTMPGWAGSSWYWLRYMDAQNENEFCSKEALDYWQNVDLYIGGSEHATGHLLYSRFWNKFLKDTGFAPTEEPFKKLINQGMILGMSAFVKRYMPLFLVKIWIDDVEFIKKNPIMQYNPASTMHTNGTLFVSDNIEFNDLKMLLNKTKEQLQINIQNHINNQLTHLSHLKLRKTIQFKNEVHKDKIYADVSFVNTSDELDIEAFRNWRPEYKNAEFLTEEKGVFKVSREVEKMSKSKYNVVNPDDICNEYGADTLRLYEMFLGPLEQAKPWNTAGITGVHNFLKKLWKLYHTAPSNSPEGGEPGAFYVSDDEPTKEMWKSLHKTIKKVIEDIENFSFNTSVSTFMIAVNELTALKCNHREILEPLTVLISPYAPHIAEELWEKLGHTNSISTAAFPKFDPKHLVESTKEYPVSFNGKTRFTMELSLDLSVSEIEKIVMAHEKTQQYLEGRTPKKVIIVPGKIINIVG